VKGGIHLVCGPDSVGRSALTAQYVSAPMHISKPWWEEGLLIVNAINSTAGLLSGDVIENRIEVKPGGRLLVTSPSATRAYRMRAGAAEVRQTIEIANGGWLEMWPALFIPHAGSHYIQNTSASLDPGARFLWFETFARFAPACAGELLDNSGVSFRPRAAGAFPERMPWDMLCRRRGVLQRSPGRGLRVALRRVLGRVHAAGWSGDSRADGGRG
jgi:hypothetical protein